MMPIVHTWYRCVEQKQSKRLSKHSRVFVVNTSIGKILPSDSKRCQIRSRLAEFAGHVVQEKQLFLVFYLPADNMGQNKA